jgi:hypothetical protein
MFRGMSSHGFLDCEIGDWLRMRWGAEKEGFDHRGFVTKKKKKTLVAIIKPVPKAAINIKRPPRHVAVSPRSYLRVIKQISNLARFK